MKLLILISIVYVNKKGHFKNSIEFYTFFLWEEFYTLDFKAFFSLLNKLNSYAHLSLIPLLFFFFILITLLLTFWIFLCIVSNSFLIWKKIINDIKKLSEWIFFFFFSFFYLSFIYTYIYIYIYIYIIWKVRILLKKLLDFFFNVSIEMILEWIGSHKR